MPEKFAPRFSDTDRLIRTPPGTLLSRLKSLQNHSLQLAKIGE
jgi:hypothetical protein